MKKIYYENQSVPRQVIELTLLQDRIIATCNGATAIFPLNHTPYELASEIYGLAYSGDDKRHRVKKTGEIADWLINGDNGEGRSIIELTTEWLEYDQEPEKDGDE